MLGSKVTRVDNAREQRPEEWIEIEETFLRSSPGNDLLLLFQSRYGPTLWDTPWESAVRHQPACASAGGGGCDCEVEVHVTQPTLHRRIRLRWAPPRS
jgi:hypothetical protein